jgi:ribosome-associated toxin RatA of RatAB toxin-antitoxin module
VPVSGDRRDPAGLLRRPDRFRAPARLAGRGAIVEYEVDARVKRVRYRLRQVYDEPHRLASEYLGGDFRDFAGEWRFIELDGGRTRAELDLRIDPGRLVPGPVRGLIADAVMNRALRDLQRLFS